MRVFRASVISVSLVLPSGLACGGDEAKDAKEGTSEESGGGDAKVNEAAAGGKGAGTGPADSVGDTKSSAVTGCPKQLKGREKTDRLIKKECGTVKVTGDYSFDGATLTIEGGVTLEFEPGTGLGVGYYEPAKLVIKATKEEPVTLTSAGDKAAGVWKGVTLYEKAARSEISGMVVEYAGGKSAGLVMDAEDVSLTSSTIRHSKNAGIVAEKKGSFAAFTGNTFEDVGRIAMRVTPAIAGQIGEGNTFAADSGVFVKAGKIEADTTWAAIGAPFVLLGDTHVSGKDGAQATLSLAPGVTLKFDGDAGIGIGYYAEGHLKAVGSADKKITFTSDEKQEAGAWGGIQIHAKGEAEVAHAIFEFGGKKANEGVFQIKNSGSASINDSQFRKNTAGLVVDGTKSTLESFDRNTVEETPIAVRLPGRSVAALGAANTYTGETKIEIEGGRMNGDFVWKPQATRVELTKDLSPGGGTLELQPGYEMFIKDGLNIDVAYYEAGALKLMGEADKPIKLTGVRDDAGAWKSIVFHRNAHGNVVQHVVLRNAGGDGGVVFKRESDGKVDTLLCEKCSGESLVRDDKAKVESTGVSASE